MRIYPAVHYTMGGLWVDYNLQSTLPGLFVLGEANFSDHGANRLGASALMQGLADGYFIAPYIVANYLAGATLPKLATDHDAFKEAAANAQGRIDSVLGVKGTARFANSIARWDTYVGPPRHRRHGFRRVVAREAAARAARPDHRAALLAEARRWAPGAPQRGLCHPGTPARPTNGCNRDGPRPRRSPRPGWVRDGPLPLGAVIAVGAQVARGLHHCHSLEIDEGRRCIVQSQLM